jgi:hypothetical protein
VAHWSRPSRPARGIDRSGRTPPTSGYHDTITWAFLRLLAEVRRQQPPAASAEDLAAQAVAVLSDRTVLTRYYSPDVLASPEARRRVMPPDRQALP